MQYVTGIACRSHAYTVGGYIFWLGALLCVVAFFINGSQLQFVILALSMIFGFIVPGYKANKRRE